MREVKILTAAGLVLFQPGGVEEIINLSGSFRYRIYLILLPLLNFADNRIENIDSPVHFHLVNHQGRS